MATSRYASCPIASYTARGFQGYTELSPQLSQDEETEWEVSVLKCNEMFKHTSVLFESSTSENPVCLELLVDAKIDEVMLRGQTIDLTLSKYKDLVKDYRGKVRMSASKLVQTAKRTLENFGDYQYALNNCQDFSEALTKQLGCRSCLTDTEKGLLWGLLGVVAVVAVAVVAFMAGGKTGGETKGTKK